MIRMDNLKETHVKTNVKINLCMFSDKQNSRTEKTIHVNLSNKRNSTSVTRRSYSYAITT
jgi:hypothetical protein